MKTDVSLLAQPKPMPFTRKMIIEFLYLVWMGALPLVSSSVLGYYAISNPDFFQSLQGVELFVFWCLAIFIMGLAFSPTTFFALFTGYIWGLNGIIPLIIAYSMASLLGFFVAKLFKGEAILTFIKSKFKSASFLDHVQSNSFSWVFLARLSPVFPFAITNAIMAFLGVSAQKFFIAGRRRLHNASLPSDPLTWGKHLHVVAQSVLHLVWSFQSFLAGFARYFYQSTQRLRCETCRRF